jgi:hypothetical protein
LRFVSEGEFIPLKCRSDVLKALATGLTRFGPAGGAPDWLVSGIWLCTDKAELIATASAEVLADGYLARPLSVCSPQELMAAVESDLPDIEGRLMGRGCNLVLPGTSDEFVAPKSLSKWHAGDYSTSVLIRVVQGASATHRVACGLLFETGSRKLLAGTDVSSLAMVLSEDPELIGRYRSSCEEVSAADFLDSFEG